MRSLKGIRWLFATFLISGAASADIIIDSSVLPGTEIKSITIGSVSGNVFVTTNDGNYAVTSGSTEPPPPEAAAITSFVASSVSIKEGESTTISWTTRNATECAASGGSVGWESSSVALNDSKTIVIDTADTYIFVLTCQGPTGPVEKQLPISVSVSTPSNTANCPTPSLSGQTVEWNTFWNDSFPNPVYSNVNSEIPRNGYFALEFETSEIVDTGQLISVELTTTSGVRLGAISECPGEFDVPDECKHLWGVGGGIIWSTENYSGSCKLKPDTTYYFNITFTDGISSTTSKCLSSKCITRLRAVNPR